MMTPDGLLGLSAVDFVEDELRLELERFVMEILLEAVVAVKERYYGI
jgi:hypothetical protein